MENPSSRTDRYAIRPDAGGFSVVDVWTGEPLRLAMEWQTGLSEDDARHTAELFNNRVEASDGAARS